MDDSGGLLAENGNARLRISRLLGETGERLCREMRNSKNDEFRYQEPYNPRKNKKYP